MPPAGSPPNPRRRRALDALLADLGPQLCRGPKLRSDPLTEATKQPRAGKSEGHLLPNQRIPSGYGEIDELLGGGFPRGRLSEITGPACSGRTSLALALLATTTRCGQIAAVVDGVDAFDPLSAETAGVDLDCVLWARAPAWREGLRCCERLLQTGGIPLVLLDLANDVARPAATGHRNSVERAPEVAWLRLARHVKASRSVLVVLSTQRLTGSHAEIVLEMQNANAHFSGSPALLEELEIRAVLARHRGLPIDQTVSVRLGTRSAA